MRLNEGMTRRRDTASPPQGATLSPDGKGRGDADASPEAPRLSLRVLATSDVHMHLLPHDYLTGLPSPRLGLARTASLIAARRAEVPASLLLDNGDFLQGSPMGDIAARPPRGSAESRRPTARPGRSSA